MRLYISNLHPHISKSELQSLLQEFGSVESIEISTENYASTSTCEAYIEMPDAEASLVIEHLSGDFVHGMPISISVFQDQASRTATPGRGFQAMTA